MAVDFYDEGLWVLKKPVSLAAVRQIMYVRILGLHDLLVTTRECPPLLTCMYYLLQELSLIFCFVFNFGCVFVIFSNALLILRMDLIHSQNAITAFALFVRTWYLLKTATVVLVHMYVTEVMVAVWMSAVRIWGLIRDRKYYRRHRLCPMIRSDIVSNLRIPPSSLVGCQYSWLRSILIDFSAWAYP